MKEGIKVFKKIQGIIKIFVGNEYIQFIYLISDVLYNRSQGVIQDGFIIVFCNCYVRIYYGYKKVSCGNNNYWFY